MKKIFIALIILVMYVTTSELSAKKKAESFCNTIAIGDNSESIPKQALDAGARSSGLYMNANGPNKSFFASFTGFFPGSDFICEIDSVNGSVVSKNPYLIKSLLQ